MTDLSSDNPYALLRPYWRLVLAAFLGWFLDAFDQVALILLLPQIGQHFGVSLTAMGFVITAQSVGRIFGNIGWGWLADRYGRKLTFMLGVVWFAAFSGLTGLAWSYAALVVIQLFFGIGFGGEWTASAALLMESVPGKAREVASSLMMAGYEFGFLAAAGAQALLVPHFGWRSLFFVGVAPALLAIFIRIGIKESPVWLRLQREKAERLAPRAGGAPAPAERPRFRLDAAAVQACAFMAVVQFLAASVYDFYPTLLEKVHGWNKTQVFGAIAAYSIGSILGKLAAGRTAARIGDRVTILALLAVTALVLVPFTRAVAGPAVIVTAFVIGASNSGVFALVPHFLSLRFASAVRSFGMGIAYALAAAAQGVATTALPASERGLGLGPAIVVFVGASALCAAAIISREPRVLPGRDMDERDAQ